MIELPRHPFVPYRELSRSFAKKHVPALRARPFLWAMILWRKIFRIDQAERRVQGDINAGLDGYYHEDWIFKNLFYPQVSATLLGDVEPEDPLVRAAQVAYGAAQFYLNVRKGLDTEYIGGRVQDMGRYRFFFSRPTLSFYKHGTITHRITPQKETDYIVVWLRGRPFKMRVIEAGKPISVSSLNRALQHIVRHLESQGAPPVGLLTVAAHKDSCHLWERFETLNPESVKTLNKGLFALCIDLDCQASSLDAVHSSLHAKGFENRDWRQTLQIAVNGKGYFGLIVNPYPGLGGTLSARFTAEVAKSCRKLAPMSPCVAAENKVSDLVAPIVFTNGAIPQSKLDKLKKDALKRLYPKGGYQTSFRLDGVGFVALKRAGISPGAAVIVALSLAWYRLFGHAPTIGNFINLRGFQHGDIWRYDASGPALEAFVKDPNPKPLKEAEKAYKQLVKYHKKAEDEFYLGAMTLKKIVSDRTTSFLSFVTLMLICAMSVRNFNRRFMNPNIWISGIPAYDGMKAVGRPGSTMDYLERDCLGGHYMLFSNHVKLCLLAPPGGRHYGQEDVFAKAFKKALADVLEIAKKGSILSI